MQQPETNITYVGYARVTTNEQRLDLQLNALRDFGVPEQHIFGEHKSGAALKRPMLEKSFKYLRRGDTFVVWKLDRLSSDMEHIAGRIKRFKEWGVKLKSLTEGFDTMSASGTMVAHMMGSTGQYERDAIIERTKAGIQAAKGRGTWRKRSPTIDEAQWDFMLFTLRDNPLLSSNALVKHLDMPLRGKKQLRPKRTTVNNYMAMLKAPLEGRLKCTQLL